MARVRGEYRRRVAQTTRGLVLVLVGLGGFLAPALATDVAIDLRPDDPIYRELRLAANLGLLADPLRGADPVSREEVFRLLTPLAADITRKSGMLAVAPDTELGLTPATAHRLTRLRDHIVPWEMFWEDRLYPTDFGFSLYRRVELSAADVSRGLRAPDYLDYGYDHSEGVAFASDAEAFIEGEALAFATYGRLRVDRDAVTYRPISLYFRAGWRNLRATMGREAVAWGPAVHGGLILSSNARPLDQIRVESERPFRLPGPLRHAGSLTASALVGKLDDPHRRDAVSPWLVGTRVTLAPTRWLVLGVTRTTMVGGEGSGFALTWGSLGDLILGRNANRTGADIENDTDHRAGVDWTVYLWPALRHVPLFDGGRFYGEYAGEDSPQNGPLPSANATTYGMELVAKGVLLRAEATNLREDANLWYWHRLYTDGYTTRGRVMGFPSGGDSRAQSYAIEAPLGTWGLILLGMERQEHGFKYGPGEFPGNASRPVPHAVQDVFRVGVEKNLGSLPGAIGVEARVLREWGDVEILGPLEDWGISLVWRQ